MTLPTRENGSIDTDRFYISADRRIHGPLISTDLAGFAKMIATLRCHKSNLAMTALPTRKDGGIDWERVMPAKGLFTESLRLAFIEMMKEAAAHERERCAKWHDEQKRWWREQAKTHPKASASEQYAEDRANDHEDYAADLRKLEP